jgi:hypothetical protein
MSYFTRWVGARNITFPIDFGKDSNIFLEGELIN